METILNSMIAFFRIAEYGMVGSKKNIVKNDLFRMGEDFRRSANDLNNSYKNFIKMSNEQQK